MKLVPLHRGVPVGATGIAVRTRGGMVLVDPAHFTADLLPNAPFLFEELDFAVPLVGEEHADLEPGHAASVSGVWSGDSLTVRHLDLMPGGPLLRSADSPLPPHVNAAAPPANAPGPPGELEQQLLRDGIITNRLPYADGTLHVVADDVARARELLEPLYGGALRVARAVYTQHERHVALDALRVVDALNVMCGAGEAPLDLSSPTERVHTIEVVWITDELAEALAPVPDGLIRVTSHVEVAVS